MKWSNMELIEILKKGGVAVMPTDTIYGIVGLAQNVATVHRIYNLKKRNPEKPCIILLGDIKQLEEFSITLSERQKTVLEEYWPGPVSVIFDCVDEALSYLHRGTNTLAFRLPSSESLKDLLNKVGPLIAPSANPEGLPPAQNTTEAKKYFGDSVDFYLDGGTITGKASKLIKLHKDGTVSILRA
ncbi:MAG: L-threonylcarbamoyladenylate synthase [Candidatus Pacebacteria bacterium]|nr:L-threonylcarbamoyladenylate synthase [Candidatus Paceibacterota bacterium]